MTDDALLSISSECIELSRQVRALSARLLDKTVGSRELMVWGALCDAHDALRKVVRYCQPKEETDAPVLKEVIP